MSFPWHFPTCLLSSPLALDARPRACLPAFSAGKSACATSGKSSLHFAWRTEIIRLLTHLLFDLTLGYLPSHTLSPSQELTIQHVQDLPVCTRLSVCPKLLPARWTSFRSPFLRCLSFAWSRLPTLVKDCQLRTCPPRNSLTLLRPPLPDYNNTSLPSPKRFIAGTAILFHANDHFKWRSSPQATWIPSGQTMCLCCWHTFSLGS